MDNIFSDAGEQIYEIGKDTGKKFVKEVVKGVPKAAKSQIMGSNPQNQGQAVGSEIKDNKKQGVDDKKKMDPVTGKPVPSKVMLSSLQQATAKLQMTKLQKIREELEKQRLKASSAPFDGAQGKQGAAGNQEKGQQIDVGQEGTGPEVPAEKPKPKEDVVQKMLKKSQGTSEYKGGVDG